MLATLSADQVRAGLMPPAKTHGGQPAPAAAEQAHQQPWPPSPDAGPLDSLSDIMGSLTLTGSLSSSSSLLPGSPEKGAGGMGLRSGSASLGTTPAVTAEAFAPTSICAEAHLGMPSLSDDSGRSSLDQTVHDLSAILQLQDLAGGGQQQGLGLALPLEQAQQGGSGPFLGRSAGDHASTWQLPSAQQQEGQQWGGQKHWDSQKQWGTAKQEQQWAPLQGGFTAADLLPPGSLASPEAASCGAPSPFPSPYAGLPGAPQPQHQMQQSPGGWGCGLPLGALPPARQAQHAQQQQQQQQAAYLSLHQALMQQLPPHLELQALLQHQQQHNQHHHQQQQMAGQFYGSRPNHMQHRVQPQVQPHVAAAAALRRSAAEQRRPRPEPRQEDFDPPEALIGVGGLYQPYCRQVISPAMNDAATQALTSVKLLQAGDSPAATLLAGKRYFCSLKEVAKVVPAARCIIVAPDVKVSPAAQINPVTALERILAVSEAAGVPVFFALSRRGIGQVFGRDKCMSTVAVMHLEGVEQQFVTMAEEAAKGRELFQQHKARAAIQPELDRLAAQLQEGR